MMHAHQQSVNLKANIALGLIFAFMAHTLSPVPNVQAQPISQADEEFSLPVPGKMVALSPAYSPAVLKGIQLDPKNPFCFHFFVDRGDRPLHHDQELRSEATKLIKYFLASLTIPEKDLWVNLSPYEKDRIVPQEFGQTEMGRDLLAEDYILKQMTASLIYPESKLGKKFWQKVYAQAKIKYGTTNIPVNTFNKVWIVPDKAVVYENGGTAYVLKNHLKVMLEQDYLALSKNTISQPTGDTPTRGHVPLDAGAVSPSPPATSALGSQIIREIVIPALTKEVNEGKNFAQLRQVFYSLILATWYKKKIKNSILVQIYADKKKVAGVGYEKSIIPVLPTRGHVPFDAGYVPPSPLPSELAMNVKAPQGSPGNAAPNDVERIYQRYLTAFKKGVFNYIKAEALSIPGTPSKEQGMFPRKYFSGGVNAQRIGVDMAMVNAAQVTPAEMSNLSKESIIDVTADVAVVSQTPSPPTENPFSKRVFIGSGAYTKEEIFTLLAHFNEEKLQIGPDVPFVKTLAELKEKVAPMAIRTSQAINDYFLPERKMKPNLQMIEQLKIIYAMDLENAMDAFLQKREMSAPQERILLDKLEMSFYYYVIPAADGHEAKFGLLIANNGVPLAIVEDTAFKKKRRIERGLGNWDRFGGLGLALSHFMNITLKQLTGESADVERQQGLDTLKKN